MKHFTTKESLRQALILIFSALLVILACNTEVKELTLMARSRMYLNFKEEHKVKMYERFPIGDTDLEGVVVEFYPDFAIDTLTHKTISRSDTLYNPAAKILIIEGGEKREEVYAFSPGLMPHYSPRSFIGFELVSFKAGSSYIKAPTATPKIGIKND